LSGDINVRCLESFDTYTIVGAPLRVLAETAFMTDINGHEGGCVLRVRAAVGLGHVEEAETQAARVATSATTSFVFGAWPNCRYAHLAEDDSIGGVIFNNVREGAVLCLSWQEGGARVKGSRMEGERGEEVGGRYDVQLEREGVSRRVIAGEYLRARDILRYSQGGVSIMIEEVILDFSKLDIKASKFVRAWIYRALLMVGLYRWEIGVRDRWMGVGPFISKC